MGRNAGTEEQAGAGLMSEVDQFTVEWLCASLERRSKCAAQAAVLGKRIHSYGGAAAAVEVIEKWG